MLIVSRAFISNSRTSLMRKPVWEVSSNTHAAALKCVFSFLSSITLRKACINLSKYTSSIFILLVFLYLLFKNYFIFFHSHKFNLKAIGFAKLIIFLLLTIVISITFNNYLFVILAGFTILLLIPENIASKTAVILFLSVFSILNSIDYNKNELQKNKYLEIINKPVSKNYIERYLEKNKKFF